MFKLATVLAVVCVVSAAPKSKPIPMDGRIVGGQNTDIAWHPWQVSVQHQNSHFCGGFLISDVWVVTAAHCITKGFRTDLNIRAGSTIWNNGGQTVPVSSFIIHPFYDDNNLNNDVALLRLAAPVNVANARAAALPRPGQEVGVGSPVSITGWGALGEQRPGPLILQEVVVPALNRDDCRRLYSVGQITNEMFCAGVVGIGGKDACQGDSGGPAVVDGVVVGVVSWGRGCARPQWPGVYAQVSAVRDWITQNTGI
ncbi:hypothetical protein JTB14_031200 [Gonioctena quinquepunctata]|nr:hypothetical protein JTB14_031200 [Gonioctena quinquepunctata]